MQTLYAFLDPMTNTIELSAYKIDDPAYENNHTKVRPAVHNSAGAIMEVQFFFGILSNIMFQAGIRLEQQ